MKSVQVSKKVTYLLFFALIGTLSCSSVEKKTEPQKPSLVQKISCFVKKNCGD